MNPVNENRAVKLEGTTPAGLCSVRQSLSNSITSCWRTISSSLISNLFPVPEGIIFAIISKHELWKKEVAFLLVLKKKKDVDTFSGKRKDFEKFPQQRLPSR